MPASGSLSTVSTVKEYAQTYKPLILARFDFINGNVLRVCSAPLNVGEAGQTRDTGVIENIQYYEDTAWVDYLGRILNQRMAATQALSASGLNMTPSVTLDLADADAYIWSTFEGSSGPGFKGAKLTLRFVFWEPDTRNFSTDFIKVFYGRCESPATTETVLSITTNSMLNFSHVELPRVKIQKRCPWLHPDTTEQKALANIQGTKFYPCGDTDAGNTSCNYTKDASGGDSCVDNGLWNLTTGFGRYGGIQYQPPTDWTGNSFLSEQLEKGKNTGNAAKYDQYIPLVYGGGRYQPPIANVVGNANQTLCEVILGLDEWGYLGAAFNNSISKYVTVQINGYNVAHAGSGLDITNAHWNWINTGARDGNASADPNYALKGDPYGNIAAIVVMIVNNVARSDTVPQVVVKLGSPSGPCGRMVRTYATAGGSVAWKATLNPAWITYDLAVEGGWDEGDIDKQTFIDAAAVCDVSVGGFLRFSQHLVVRDPVLLSNLLRGFMNGFRGSLLVREKLELHIRGTLSHQQGSAVDGSNDATGYSSPALTGAGGTGYVAYSFDETNILREGTESTLAFDQLTGDDAPNRISIRFQDSLKQYHEDSMTVLDNGDVLRLGGKEVTATFPVLGLQLPLRAKKVLRTLMAELHRGNPRTSGINQDGTSGTWIAIFKTTAKAVHLKADDIIHLSSTRYSLVKQLFRVQRITPSPDFEEIEIEASWHEDEWYIDTFGNQTDPDYSNPARDRLPRAPYPWQAYKAVHPGLNAGAFRDDPMWPGEYTFGMGISGETMADGSVNAFVKIIGKLGVNSFATGDAMPPHVDTEMESYSSGGFLEGSTEYWACVCGKTSDGKITAPSHFAKAVTPGSGSNCRVVMPFIEWGAGVTGYVGFLGTNPNRLSMQVEGNFGVPPTQLTFTTHYRNTWGVPDVEADRFQLRVKKVRHSGIWGQSIDEIVGINGILIAAAGWVPNEHAGRIVSVLSDESLQEQGTGAPMPPKNYLVAGNTVDTLSLAGSVNLVTEEVEAGDALIMRFTPTAIYTGSSPGIRDAKIINNLLYRKLIQDITDDGTGKIRIWITAHGYINGATLLIEGVTGTIEANGTWIISVTNADYYDLTGSSFVNPYTGEGWGQSQGYMPDEEIGATLRIIAGKGRGSLSRITSNTQDTVYVERWEIEPDSTSVWIIEEPTWVRSDPTESFNNFDLPNVFATPDYSMSAEISNYVAKTILVSPVLLDGGGNESFDSPVREMFFAGLPGVGVRDWTARILDPSDPIAEGEDLAGNWYRVDVDSGIYVELRELIAQLKVAPADQDLVVDILVSIDEGENWTSILGEGNEMIVAVGETTATVTVFSVSTLARGNILRYDVIQAGGSNAEFALRGRKYSG